MYITDNELTPMQIVAIIQDYKTREVPRLLKYRNYYDGKQKILQKKYSDPDKPCNKIVTNFMYSIVKNYQGYLAGVPIRYNNDDEALDDVLNYNDYKDEDSELMKDLLIFGEAYEIEYIDEESKTRFKQFSPLECIPVYRNTLDEIFNCVIRFYKIKLTDELSEEWYVEVYRDDKKITYKSTPGFASLEFLKEEPNYFNQVPLTRIKIEDSIFKQVIDLQDAYNSILSDSIDDFDAFADAYLMLKGMSGTTAEDIAQMKQDRVLLLDADGDASFLVKSMADAQTQERLDKIEEKIYKIANCVDFYNTDFITSASSGTALRYRLMGMENNASTIESAFRKGVQKRVELIYSILSMTEGEDLWRDVEIVFTRNIPDLTTPQTPQEIMAYRNFVSDKTLLGLLNFVESPEEEIAEVQKQMANSMSLYGFPVKEDEDEQVLDEEEDR